MTVFTAPYDGLYEQDSEEFTPYSLLPSQFQYIVLDGSYEPVDVIQFTLLLNGVEQSPEDVVFVPAMVS